MATQLNLRGKTVADHLEELYGKYGHFLTANSYFICREKAKTDRIFAELRERLIDPVRLSSLPFFRLANFVHRPRANDHSLD